MTETTYLEEAAAELRKARDDNDRRAEIADEMRTARLRADDLDAEVSARNLEIAAGFTRLAAIDAGLPPCCHVLRLEPGQETP